MSLPHQDWEPVILRKKKVYTKTKKTGAGNSVLKKKNKVSDYNPTGKKSGDDDEIKKLKYVGKDIGKKMQHARLQKKLTQKQVAQKLNIQQSVYQQYEIGKALRNGNLLNRIGKVLGVKLTGKGV